MDLGLPWSGKHQLWACDQTWKIMREWRAYPAVRDWGGYGGAVAGIAMTAPRPRRYERMKWTSMIGKMPWIVGFRR